jgi:hypothetical protein
MLVNVHILSVLKLGSMHTQIQIHEQLERGFGFACCED